MIRFFVMNEVCAIAASHGKMRIGNERVGYSGLCIQSNISRSLGAIEEWKYSLVDAYLVPKQSPLPSSAATTASI